MKKFANYHGFSDVEPFEVVKVINDKTIEIRRMTVVRDPSWKPEIIPGGFAGHCVNNHEQRWFYSSDETAPILRCRLHKDGYYHSTYGRHLLADAPRKFYDYNF